MEINFTKEQYEYLIKAIEAGSSVYGILGDSVSEDYKRQSNAIEELRKYLLSHAHELDANFMVEKYKGEVIMSDAFSEKLQEVIDDYDDETFWSELETRLGKRDFEKTMTEAERKEMQKNNGWYPERIHEIYESWNREFEKNGVERLGIVSDKDTNSKAGI